MMKSEVKIISDAAPETGADSGHYCVELLKEQPAAMNKTAPGTKITIPAYIRCRHTIPAEKNFQKIC